jgi:class 3 adenylate cyclase/tetratricopeptide (TPR) repeat protein
MAGCAGCGADNPAGARFCNACGAALASVAAGADGETRKTVTVVFCDVTGSTSLGEQIDPESLRRVLARYFTVMRTVVERYGGTVEKFIGDAVMAVFGVPTVHEDDALRAVRAAWGMTEALAALNEELVRDFGTSLQVRIGVDTGEVVTGTSERLATGDTVNIAARLEQSAAPGEILIGEQTFRLTHDVVDVEDRQLELKGKSLPVPAYRMLSVRPDNAPRRRLDAPMVGREVERRRLHDAFDDVVRTHACRLFTIVGAPGVGKTRLTRDLSETNHSATLYGRCLSYGEGVTYWPIVEALAPVAPRLSALALETGAATTIELLLSGSAMASTDEIAWAFRKLVEAVAAESPVKLLFDDIQWGEDAFLDLVEHLALLSRDAPILVVCLARPELLEKRPGWTVDVHLEPLPAADAEQLVDQCTGSAGLADETRARILAAAGGNPLFVEEMTAMVQASGDGDVLVPPSIQALLAARIDQLDPLERRVLARAAVEGEVFHRGAIQALLPEEHNVTARLSSLVRKDMVKPHPAQLQGEDGFRFRHLLIRDAAYESIPKAVRAELHERFARWFDGKMAERRPEAEAILGYHLEQAASYRVALGPADSHSRELALEAGSLFASAGNRTLARGDAGAAITLLERAASVLPPGETARLAALLQLGWATRLRGDLRRATEIVNEVTETAVSSGQRALEIRAKIVGARLGNLTASVQTSEVLRAAQAAMPILEQLGDDAGLAQAWQGIGHAEFDTLHNAAMVDALERSTLHAQRAGDEAVIMENDLWIPAGRVTGPTPASEMARIAADMRDAGSGTPRHEHAWVLLAAMAAAFGGRFDEAREFVARGEVIGGALGQMDTQAYPLELSRRVELLAGDTGAAERAARRCYEIAQRAGAVGYSCTGAALLALVLYDLGRRAEAAEYMEISRNTGASDDVANEVLWRRAAAKLCARRGDAEDALRLAGEAVALMETTDAINEHGDALVDLAEVLCLLGRADDAVEPLQRALALYERKENLVSATGVRARLADLAGAAYPEPSDR